MGFDDVMGVVDTVLGTKESDDENDSLYSTFMSLWRRMDIVVKVLMREKRKEEALKCVLAFFKDIGNLSKLEKLVEEGENKITDEPETIRASPIHSLEPDS